MAVSTYTWKSVPVPVPQSPRPEPKLRKIKERKIRTMVIDEIRTTVCHFIYIVDFFIPSESGYYKMRDIDRKCC